MATYNERLTELVATDRIGKITFYDVNGLLVEINKGNDLIEFTIKDDIYVDGSFIGSVSAKEIKIKLINDDFKYSYGANDLNGKEIKVYTGITLNEEGALSDVYNSWGTFIVTSVKNGETDNSCEITAYDYIIKLNQKYLPTTTFDETTSVFTVLYDICAQCGIPFSELMFNNSDFIITSNQYEGYTCREVVSDIAKLAGGFTKIVDDKLQICNLGTEVNDLDIDKNVIHTLKTQSETTPINTVIIGDSVAEGEESVRTDSGNIAYYGYSTIELNDIKFLITEEDRESVIDNIYSELYGMYYKPFETKYFGFDTYRSGDMVTLYDIDDVPYITYIFNHKFTFNGSFSGEISTPALSKIEKDNKVILPTSREASKTTEIRINRAEQSIDLLVSKTDDLETSVSEIGLTTDDISLSVKRSGGINLLKNSSAQNETKYWGYELGFPYIESDTPPESPADYQYWYCTLTADGYTENTMYYFDAGTEVWELSSYTKQELEENNFFIIGVTALNSNNYDSDELRENFAAGSAFKIDPLPYESYYPGYMVAQPIDITDDYYNIELVLKNDLVDGYIIVGCDQTNEYVQNTSDIYSNILDSSYMFIYPEQNQGAYTTYNLQIPITGVSDLLFGTISNTEPATPQEGDLWLDTTNLYGEILYIYEDGDFVIYTEIPTDRYLSVCDNLTKAIWQSFYMEGMFGWTETTIDYTKFIVKQVAPYINVFPNIYNIIPSATEPEYPTIGCYWLDTVNEKVFRASFIEDTETGEYVFDQFIERTDLDYTTISSDGYIIASGSVVVGDIMLVSGTQPKAWTCARDEVYGKLVKIDGKGLTVSTYENDNTMNITEAEIVARKGEEKVFQISGYKTILRDTEIENTLTRGKILTVIKTNGTDDYFVS